MKYETDIAGTKMLNIAMGSSESTVDMVPELFRHRLVVEMIPMHTADDRGDKALFGDFQRNLAQLCGVETCVGPVVITPETHDDGVDYGDFAFRAAPHDSNAFMIWRKSHLYTYLYKNSGLLAVEMSLCSNFDREKALSYIHDYWRPVRGTMRWAAQESNGLVGWSPYEKLDSWENIPEVLDLRKNIINLLPSVDFKNPEHIRQYGGDLRRLLLEAQKTCGGWLASSLDESTIQAVQKLYGEWEWTKEVAFAERAIAGRVKDLTECSLEHYPVIARSEVAAAGIDSQSILVQVGSGIPITAGMIGQIAHPRHIYCIERQPERVELGRQFVHSMGQDNTISMIHGDGATIDFPPNTSHIDVTAMAEDKGDFLFNCVNGRNIATNIAYALGERHQLKQGTRVIWRTTGIENLDGDNVLFYDAPLPMTNNVYRPNRQSVHIAQKPPAILSFVVDEPSGYFCPTGNR